MVAITAASWRGLISSTTIPVTPGTMAAAISQPAGATHGTPRTSASTITAPDRPPPGGEITSRSWRCRRSLAASTRSGPMTVTVICGS